MQKAGFLITRLILFSAPERILQSLPLLSDHTLSKNVVDTFEREKNLTLSGITLHSGDRYVLTSDFVGVLFRLKQYLSFCLFICFCLKCMS